MIFLPTPRRFATVQDDETNMRRNPFVAHARLMTVVVSPRLQSFMERRQCYMVRDYIRHIHIVPVKSHNTLEVDRKPSHQSLTDLKSNGPSLRADTAKAVVHRTTLRSQGARSARTLDPTRARKEAPSGAAREPTWHVVASRLSTAAREGIEHVSDVQPSRKKPLVNVPTRVQTMRASNSFQRDSFTEASERLPGPSL